MLPLKHCVAVHQSLDEVYFTNNFVCHKLLARRTGGAVDLLRSLQRFGLDVLFHALQVVNHSDQTVAVVSSRNNTTESPTSSQVSLECVHFSLSTVNWEPGFFSLQMMHSIVAIYVRIKMALVN